VRGGRRAKRDIELQQNFNSIYLVVCLFLCNLQHISSQSPIIHPSSCSLLLLLPRDLSIYLSRYLSVMNKFVEMDDGIMAVLRIDS
jgi:hypothetical protein